MHTLREMRNPPPEEPPPIPIDPQEEIPRLQRRNRVLAVWVGLSIVFAIIGWVIGLTLGSMLRSTTDDAHAALKAANDANAKVNTLAGEVAAKDTIIAGLRVQLASAHSRISLLASSVQSVEGDLADVAATIDAENYATKADVEQAVTAASASAAAVQAGVADSLSAFSLRLATVEPRLVAMQSTGIDVLRTELRSETGRIKRHLALTDAVVFVWSIINSVKR